jgi:hypothetical protein
MENYSFYLFSKLFDAIIGHEYEYDLMYRDIKNLYTFYQMSYYNDMDQDEYSCMYLFFIDNGDSIKNQDYLLDIAQLNK